MPAVRVTRLAVAAALLGALFSARPARAQAAPAQAALSTGQARGTAVAATALNDIRSWDSAVDRMQRDGDLQVRATADDTLMPGRTHERLDQFYKGVPVFGGDI